MPEFLSGGVQKAKFYKKHSVFHSQGTDCYLPIPVSTSEGYLISIGNNVWITHGTKLIAHDASVMVVKKAKKIPWVDKIGKIDIKDNVFIGNNVLVLPGVTIGPNAVIGAGSVVTRDVPPNSVGGGNPFVVKETFDEYAEKLVQRTKAYPWNGEMSHEQVTELRKNFFWGE